MGEKLALAIIVKDEIEQVADIISKYGKYFDEICLAVDQKQEEFEKLFEGVAKVYRYTWCDDFSHKRNFLAEKVESPYYFRMDCDDDIQNPELIRERFNQMVEGGFDVLYLPYIYSKDEDNNVDAEHWREVIIKKRPDIYWKKSVHENVFMESQQDCNLLRDDQIKIIHNLTKEHALSSSDRNFKILLAEFAKDKENTDPRTIAYLGRVFMAKGQWDTAIKFLEVLIAKSGWQDDKYFAWIQMADCWHMLGKDDTAIACCYEALSLNTTFPDAYLKLGSIFLEKQEFQKALDWLMPGVVRKKPDTMLVVDTTVYGHRAYMNIALAFIGLGDFEQALQYFNKAYKLAPSNEFIKAQHPIFKEAFENEEYLKKLLWIRGYVRDRDPKKLEHLVNSIPETAFKDERFHALKNSIVPPKKWSDKSIVFFCGGSWEDWAAPSVHKGIGGSEEAVINIAKIFSLRGYEVKVYCTCGDMAGTYDGVEYIPVYAFNPKDEFNILIEWRSNNLPKVIAKQKFIWLHDVPYQGLFTAKNVSNFDKVIVLSEYHKSLLPECVPEEKIIVSSNGIDLSHFPDSKVRNPRRIIYTSSYDRGIEHLLRMWGDIRKEVPSAQLEIFYGWDTYDRMVKTGARDGRFKELMVKLMSQPGVTEHGRVGHKELAKEFLRSGIYVYPCHFEEISCISAMKAQAAGCVPVVVNYAALQETVKAGIRIPGKAGEDETDENFKQELIKILKDEKLQEDIRRDVLTHKEEFSWERVAEQWEQYFK